MTAIAVAPPRARVRVDVRALALPALLALALLLRVVAARTPSAHHPDEMFQYLEAAHRLVFGYGVVPWEYQAGIRNWLLPLLLAGPMALGDALSPDGNLYLALPRALMIALALVIPWSGWRLGSAISRPHGLMAALVGATWAEFVYFAPHPLSESLAGVLLLGAAVLLHGGRARVDGRALVAAGALMGLAAIARFQFAPALAVLAVAGCAADLRRWRSLIAGGLLAAAVGAAIDLSFGAAPFGWLLANVRENLLGGRAAQYGVMGPLGYIKWFEHIWGWWAVPVVPLIRIGMRRYPALFWAALANLAAHSLIAHKEYRFVEISAVLFVLLAAIGSVDLLPQVQRRFPALSPRAALGGIAALWLLASAANTAGAAMREQYGHDVDTLAATALLRADAPACGIALLQGSVAWGGYNQLHRPLPVSAFPDDPPQPYPTGGRRAALERWRAGFNRIVAAPGDAPLLPHGFARGTCTGELCIYTRPGPCRATPDSPFLIQRVFEREDQRIRADIARGFRPTP